MKSISVTVSNRGYIVLPSKIRREMNIKGGTKILLTCEKDKMILQPVASFTERLSGITEHCFGKTASEVKKYIDEERKKR